ncbi:hypothetical protein HDU96_007793 [Phlyctochytrium bullatum]|nr:hypothetical protein HDU96_007793 [Phlyctochytrium bullatum]
MHVSKLITFSLLTASSTTVFAAALPRIASKLANPNAVPAYNYVPVKAAADQRAPAAAAAAPADHGAPAAAKPADGHAAPAAAAPGGDHGAPAAAKPADGHAAAAGPAADPHGAPAAKPADPAKKPDDGHGAPAAKPADGHGTPAAAKPADGHGAPAAKPAERGHSNLTISQPALLALLLLLLLHAPLPTSSAAPHPASSSSSDSSNTSSSKKLKHLWTTARSSTAARNLTVTDRARKQASNTAPRIPFHHSGSNFRRTRKLIPGSYIVELAPDVADARAHVLDHLEKSGGLGENDVVFRTSVRSDLFNGVSFQVHEDVDTSHITTIPNAIQAWPVRRVNRIRALRSEAAPRSEDGDDEDDAPTPSDFATLHVLTGVERVRRELGLTGKGIKVAIIDSGVYHRHPALGGGFGKGHKVAFGYDLVGDDYVDESSVPKPDGDPMDDCSVESHGTHVAGIIAADARNVTKEGFVPPKPFTGVAPDVTVGAYRVFGCNAESTSTDVLMKALYLAHLDGADVINMSLGGGPSFGLDADSVAAARVAGRGVLIVGAAGNDGQHGLLTSGGTGSHDDLVSVASFDGVAVEPRRAVVGDVGMPYFPAEAGGEPPEDEVDYVFNDSGLLFNPTAAPDDGCAGPAVPVRGKIVLFGSHSSKGCSSYVRCRLAHERGAVGCFQYPLSDDDADAAPRMVGHPRLLCGSVTRAVALAMWDRAKEGGVKMKVTGEKWEEERVGFYEERRTWGMKAGWRAAGRVSYFSSVGLRGDLAIKPDIGAPGADILSTVSPYAAKKARMPWAYNFLSGTSMASPYFAGTLALYLEARRRFHVRPADLEPAALRHEREAILTAFANAARPAQDDFGVKSVAYQGAGLVDVWGAVVGGTVVRPRAFALNDTEHAEVVHEMTVTNNHLRAVTYDVDCVGAASVYVVGAEGRPVPDRPQHVQRFARIANPRKQSVRFSRNHTTRSFTLPAGQSRTIKLAFLPPRNLSPARFPIYSGYVRVLSDASETAITVPFAGVLGRWRDATVFVKPDPYADFASRSDPAVTGVFDWIVGKGDTGKTGTAARGRIGLVADGVTVNATDGVLLKTVLASPSKLVRVEVVRDSGNEVEGYVVLDPTDPSTMAEFHFVPRNSRTDGDSVATENGYLFYGFVTKDGEAVRKVPEGTYRVRFSALKHFSTSDEDPSNFEVVESPPFRVVY